MLAVSDTLTTAKTVIGGSSSASADVTGIMGVIIICALCALATFIVLALCSNSHMYRKPHHDSMKGSFYEISNRKERI